MNDTKLIVDSFRIDDGRSDGRSDEKAMNDTVIWPQVKDIMAKMSSNMY